VIYFWYGRAAINLHLQRLYSLHSIKKTVLLGINLDRCLFRFIFKTTVFLGQRELSIVGDLIWLILLYSDELLRINKDSYKKSTQCSCHPSICLLYTNGLGRTRSLCTCYFFLFHKDYVHATWRISSSTSGIVNWSVGQYRVAFIFFLVILLHKFFFRQFCFTMLERPI